MGNVEKKLEERKKGKWPFESWIILQCNELL
jgi:hypothetical protein